MPYLQAIDLERMQPFEETCKGKLSQLALAVLADEKGVVWMYGEFVTGASESGFVLCAPLPGEFHAPCSSSYL